MDQKEYFKTRREHFTKKAKKVLHGEDILFLRALAQEEERIKNIPEQKNTLTIQDISKRKIKTKKQVIERPKKFIKEKVKREDLVFAEMKREPPILPKPSILEQQRTSIQEIKKRHIKIIGVRNPKIIDVKHADVSHWFQKKKGSGKITTNSLRLL
jgi:hypothetical protein